DRAVLEQRRPNKQLPLWEQQSPIEAAAAPFRAAYFRAATSNRSNQAAPLRAAVRNRSASLFKSQSANKAVLPGIQSETGPVSNSVSEFQLLAGTQPLYIWPGGNRGANSRQLVSLQPSNSNSR
uniref:Uncharacterized protein n=1 Tax=Aegilops tauschii subsp. strangulata TaxID=200361 RepID=A0A453Q3W8_AEGTS